MGCPRWDRGLWSRPCRGRDDRAEALGHYAIPLKRDMKPTGVGRTLQICGDPGLCSRAVNMIYSKPFPDGAIKTRGSGFGSVSWSRRGAGREQRRQRGPGTWRGLHVPSGHPAGDSRTLSPAGELSLSGAPPRTSAALRPACVTGGAQDPLCPWGCPAPLLPSRRKGVLCFVRDDTVGQSPAPSSFGPVCLSAGEQRGCCAQGGCRGGRAAGCPGHRSGQWAGDTLAAGEGRVAGGGCHPASPSPQLSFGFFPQSQFTTLFIFNY